MKRRIALTLTLPLAALALAASAPVIVAAAPQTPPPAPVSTEQPNTVQIQATATTPTSPTSSITLRVSGARPGDRVEGAVGRFVPNEALPPGSTLVVNADSSGGAVITLPPPEGAWRARTQYAWVVTVLDRGVMDRGDFTTPAWEDPGEPGTTFQTTVDLPATATSPTTFRVTGANPGDEVRIVFGRSTLGNPETEATGAVAADGSAVIVVQPSDRWQAGQRYVWYALVDDDIMTMGNVTMPTWDTATPTTPAEPTATATPKKPAPATPTPKKPAKPSNETRGGLAKTGV